MSALQLATLALSHPSPAQRRQLAALPATAVEGIAVACHQKEAAKAERCKADGEDEAERLPAPRQRTGCAKELPQPDRRGAPSRTGAGAPAVLSPDEPHAKSHADETTNAEYPCIEHPHLRGKRTDRDGAPVPCPEQREGVAAVRPTVMLRVVN